MTEIGDKIKIILMDGGPKYEGREGLVESIDDLGSSPEHGAAARPSPARTNSS